MAYQSEYPWRTRLGWAFRGYMYFVDVGEAECLDLARAMWLMGADYIDLWVRMSSSPTGLDTCWEYASPELSMAQGQAERRVQQRE